MSHKPLSHSLAIHTHTITRRQHPTHPQANILHSASGLGRATALELAQHGGNISILDLNEDAGAELVKQLGGESRAIFFPVDVTDSKSIAEAVKGTVAWVGKTGVPLGGIIPAAGVGFPGLV